MTAVDPPATATTDVVGIGFGPSNLALAVALEEGDPTAGIRAPTPTMAFYEQQQNFGWYTGMLIEGATMQVSFLKDLATMRNPSSRFTFMAYLHARGRLPSFINSKMLYPFRIEFHDYLEWVAKHFAPFVSYGSRAVSIRPVPRPDGLVDLLDVVTESADGTRATQRTRNVVIGAGLVPYLPPKVSPSERIRHSSELLTRDLDHSPKASYLVIGAGQSAAECADYLHRTDPDAEVHAVFSRYGYSVSDDSPFTNGIFDPVAVEDFYRAPEETKEMLLSYHSNTNYSVVDLDLSQELFRRAYLEEVSGRQRLRFYRTSRVRSCQETPNGVEVEVESLVTGAVERLSVSAVVYATGYRPADPLALLNDLADECKQDEAGDLCLERDYRVRTSEVLRCGIYLHGASTAGSHGLAAGLLSNTAVRAGEMARSISGRSA